LSRGCLLPRSPSSRRVRHAGTKFALFARARLPGLIGREAAEGGPGGEVVFLVDDVDVEAERLHGLRVEILAGPIDQPWGHRTLHLLDPDGFVVELAQEVPRQRPAMADGSGDRTAANTWNDRVYAQRHGKKG
jgi:lactoylglutathione lyase